MRATQTRCGPGSSRGPISPADAGDTSTTTIANRGGIRAGRSQDCRGDIRGARGFLVLHGDGPVRLADALDRRVIGKHPWPRDLFDMAGLGAVLADPVAAPIVAESVCTAAAPIQIALERVLQGGRGVALFNQCRWWSYAQGKGAVLEAWKRRVLAYVTEQNGRFHVPITAARVQSTAWSIASRGRSDGGGALDHGVMAQTRRGRGIWQRCGATSPASGTASSSRATRRGRELPHGGGGVRRPLLDGSTGARSAHPDLEGALLIRVLHEPNRTGGGMRVVELYDVRECGAKPQIRAVRSGCSGLRLV